MRGRSRIKYGMTPNLMGFTLIELLVVVLIIGILAAVAVPQYQKAVERSRATEAVTLLKSVGQAFESYFLTNGTYPTSFDDLDVNIPWERTTPKFYGYAKDTLSDGEWALEIENDSSTVILYMIRINGKYKGAGFVIGYRDRTQQLKCYERKDGALILFDENLSEGAYCERIMKAQKSSDSTYSRLYILP